MRGEGEGGGADDTENCWTRDTVLRETESRRHRVHCIARSLPSSALSLPSFILARSLPPRQQFALTASARSPLPPRGYSRPLLPSRPRPERLLQPGVVHVRPRPVSNQTQGGRRGASDGVSAPRTGEAFLARRFWRSAQKRLSTTVAAKRSSPPVPHNTVPHRRKVSNCSALVWAPAPIPSLPPPRSAGSTEPSALRGEGGPWCNCRLPPTTLQS